MDRHTEDEIKRAIHKILDDNSDSWIGDLLVEYFPLWEMAAAATAVFVAVTIENGEHPEVKK